MDRARIAGRPRMGKVAWRLRGSTDKLLECRVQHIASMAYSVTVVFGSETFLHETYPDEGSATSRAMQVYQRLVKSGAWTDATRHSTCDPWEQFH
jgi:hypothetical protein